MPGATKAPVHFHDGKRATKDELQGMARNSSGLPQRFLLGWIPQDVRCGATSDEFREVDDC